MTATRELSRAEQAALRDQCTVFLFGHGPVSAAGLLAGIPADTAVDRYGDGGVVTELEAEIAGMLGKPAAVWPTAASTGDAAVQRVELSVGDATRALPAASRALAAARARLGDTKRGFCLPAIAWFAVFAVACATGTG